VDPDDQAMLVREKVEQAEVVQGETESEEREEKDERLNEVFQFFLQRTGPRLAL
jgi:polysaccharide pyruvyl transferase WcaK-like protein